MKNMPMITHAPHPPAEMPAEEIIKCLKDDEPAELIALLRSLKTPVVQIHLGGEDLLTLAIRHKARHCIEPLKRQGISLNRISRKTGKHPLEEAMDYKVPMILEYLLEYGAEPNAPHTRHGTVLRAAAALRTVDSLIPLLCSRGGNINVPSERDGSTPLHAAVANMQTLNVEQLLECGAEVNAVDIFGRTPLQLSIALREFDPIATILLDYGAEPLLADMGGLNAVDLARVREDENLVQMLKSRASHEELLKPSFSIIQTPTLAGNELRKRLLLAVEKGNQRLIRDALEQGGAFAWVPQRENGESPLLNAFLKKRFDLAALLVGHGLGLGDRDGDGRNPVHYLFLVTEKFAILKAFLKAICRIDPGLPEELDLSGNTPLMAAKYLGIQHSREEIEALLRAVRMELKPRPLAEAA